MALANPWLIAADICDPKPHPYLHDPAGFIRDELGGHPWSKQVEILEAIRDHDRVAVRSCHGIGKTWLLAQVVIWYLAIHRDCKVITTAPTFRQVKQLLWREVRSSVDRAHRADRLHEFPESGHTQLELGTQRFALGQSSDKPEAFAGHHADHLLFVGDEASGIAEAIYEAAEGFQTAEGAKMLLAGNPTRVGGQFHAAFKRDRAQWKTIHVSALDTPNYTGEAAQLPAHVARSMIRKGWVEEKAAQWGRESPMFEVRVLGQFPSRAEDAVVSLAAVEAAQARNVPADPQQETTIISCDVARFGDDETVIAALTGDRFRILETYNGRDTVHTAGRVAHWADTFPVAHRRIVVDDDGVGGGVVDLLVARRYDVVKFNAGGSPVHGDRDSVNRRSEAWFDTAERVETLDLDGDEQLAADLSAPVYRLDARGRRVVEPKAETKKRLGRSPDRADSLVMACSVRPETVHTARRDTQRRTQAPGTIAGDILTRGF